MAYVYSKILGFGAIVAGTAEYIGPAPDGYRWVVREMAFTYIAPTPPFPVYLAPGITISLADSLIDLGTVFYGKSAAAVVTGATDRWSGRIVVPDGYYIRVGESMGGYNWVISGYELSVT